MNEQQDRVLVIAFILAGLLITLGSFLYIPSRPSTDTQQEETAA